MMKFAIALAFSPLMFAQSSTCVIKANTVGPIKAGMTIRAAKLALPGSVWKQQDDPGGATSFFAEAPRNPERARISVVTPSSDPVTTIETPPATS